MKWMRVRALCRKETLQIIRDPSSILMAFIMPAVLLFVFGYGVNLDTTVSPVALVLHDQGPAARSLAATMAGNPSLRVQTVRTTDEADARLRAGKVRGYVVIDTNFSRDLAAGDAPAMQIITDGSLPNTATVVAGNVRGVLASWQAQWLADHGGAVPAAIGIEERAWFNPSTESRNFLIPGSIVIIMTVLGALLTALVVAREWERGTMESLLATQITRGELLLAKLLPYYALAIIAMLTCMLVATTFMGVPFRGSLALLLLVTTLFLGGTLGLGLLISTKTRNQFNASQGALNAAYMPAMMLSGFVYEISSMPKAIQYVANLLPARYFVSSIQTLFQAGNVWAVLLPNMAFLAVTAALFIGLTYRITRETLE